MDPKIQVKSSKNQIDHLLSEINSQTKNNERTLVITLTKRMAEEFSKYLSKFNIKCKYIHSDIDTLERIEIIDELKKGTRRFDRSKFIKRGSRSSRSKFSSNFGCR